jgi:hypothetical protein
MSGARLFFDHHGAVHGRKVETIVYDDQFQPSRATQVCRRLIEQDKVFLIIGAGGPDEIAACARVSAQYGVPYFSSGVGEGVLRQLPNYFANTMTYRQQVPLLLDWLDKNWQGERRIGVLHARGPSFTDAVQAFAEGARARGYEVLPRQAQNGASDAQWLAQNRIEIAVPLMAPADWVVVVRSPGGAIKQWFGFAVTMGYNQVAESACPAIDGAMFFSIHPGMNQVNNIDPQFFAAGGKDDIEWGYWGAGKVMVQILDRAGRDLTREKIVQILESTRIEAGILPPYHHKPDNHFGAESIHQVFADCGQGTWVSPREALFRRGF